MAAQRTFSEFMDICEKFSMAADASKPQSPRPTTLPPSRERNIGRHNDWKDKPGDWGERPPAGEKLRKRASAVIGTQRRQDIETSVRKESFEVELAELFYVPPAKSGKSKSARKPSGKPSGKPNPSDPNYVEKYRKWIKSKQQQESMYSDERQQRRAERQQELRKTSAARQREKEERQSRLDTQVEKGIPFYDKKGKGYIRKGVKYYDSDG